MAVHAKKYSRGHKWKLSIKKRLGRGDPKSDKVEPNADVRM